MSHWRIVPLSFIETSVFSRLRERYLDDEQLRLLQASLLAMPDAGSVIRGSGGLRKVRWTSRGIGKRGGLRVIYYHHHLTNRTLLMTVYRKPEVTNLSTSDIESLRRLVNEIER
jgi:hypothetical protein